MVKKIIFTLCVAAATTLSVISCSKEEIYSCDPVVNKWTKSNLETIHSMTRSSLLRMADESYQKSALAAFTPEQKINVWLEKFTESLNFDWTEAEREHIQRLITMIDTNRDWYDSDLNENEEKLNRYDLATYEWTDYARETLKWSNKLIYGIAYTPLPLKDKSGELIYPASFSTSVRTPSEGIKKCDCNVKADQWKCPDKCSSGGCKDAVGCGLTAVKIGRAHV